MSKNRASISTSVAQLPSRSTNVIAALERFAQILQGAITELATTDVTLAEWDLRTISPSEVSALLPALRAAGEAPAQIERMRKNLQERLRAAVKKQKEEIDELVYLLDAADIVDVAGNDPLFTAARIPKAPSTGLERNAAAPQYERTQLDTDLAAVTEPEPAPSSPPVADPPTVGRQDAADTIVSTPAAREAATMAAVEDSQITVARGWRPITVTIASPRTRADLSTAQTALLGKREVLEVRPEFSSQSKVVLSLRVTVANEKLGLRRTLEELFAKPVSDSWAGDKYVATIGAQ